VSTPVESRPRHLQSEGSRICADRDEEVAAFRDRLLAEIAFAYVFLDATLLYLP
jgi:transposase-like protein